MDYFSIILDKSTPFSVMPFTFTERKTSNGQNICYYTCSLYRSGSQCLKHLLGPNARMSFVSQGTSKRFPFSNNCHISPFALATRKLGANDEAQLPQLCGPLWLKY